MITGMIKPDCAKEWNLTKLINQKAITDPEQKAIIVSLGESLTSSRKMLVENISFKGLSTYQVDDICKKIDGYLKDYVRFVSHLLGQIALPVQAQQM